MNGAIKKLTPVPAKSGAPEPHAIGPRLSEQQQRVVAHVDGPLLVLAGPGSGKTRVLTERVRALLTHVPGHFRVLALTFTNTAADEMRQRLAEGPSNRATADRLFIGTVHGFCLEMLTERGKRVGVTRAPHIFELAQDRTEVLRKAIQEDPLLEQEMNDVGAPSSGSERLEHWIRIISRIKAHPISCVIAGESLERRVLDAYDAGLRACNAYDFDDLLLLAYRLLTENPKIADLYRRIYGYICIDEAQDLNEAQYAVIQALCGDSFKNVMMVGDPKQSIFGFTNSTPIYLRHFRNDFEPLVIELTENFRSSRSVVRVAQSIHPKYIVSAQLPIEGEVQIFSASDEQAEASAIVDQLEALLTDGHPDIEGSILLSKCAILGRTRFALLAVEKELEERAIPFYKRLTTSNIYESEVTADFQLALRVMANPQDQLHFAALAKRWQITGPGRVSDAIAALTALADHACSVDGASATTVSNVQAVIAAVKALALGATRLDLMLGVAVLKTHADTLEPDPSRSLYEDLAVLEQEWDQFLRAERNPSNDWLATLSNFMSAKALGTASKSNGQGVALLTVHAAKGLEFEVVFIAGMAEGVFPDYRAKSAHALEEESRNAFVAVTRSKRLLVLSYPMTKQVRSRTYVQAPSRFLTAAADACSESSGLDSLEFADPPSVGRKQ